MKNILSDISTKIKTSTKNQKLLSIIRLAERDMDKFHEHMKKSNFRYIVDNMSNDVLNILNAYVAQKYEDVNIQVHKIPESGVNDDFGFILLGNEDYDKFSTDRYISKGNIITSEDRTIIPYPEESAEGESLLFRTSHGEVIKGDPFINDIVNDYYLMNTASLTNAYINDILNFVKK